MNEATQSGARPDILIRTARADDVPAIAAMFSSDSLGGHGDTADPAALPLYVAAFERIAASPNDTLYVAEVDGEVVGTFQTTFVTTLTGRGSSSLIVEAVHTRHDRRGAGIGAAMLAHAIEEGRRRGVRLVQLTSNLARTDAHRFYERLGFVRSHAGFKMKL
jgi:Predicted acetyltransferase